MKSKDFGKVCLIFYPYNWVFGIGFYKSKIFSFVISFLCFGIAFYMRGKADETDN